VLEWLKRYWPVFGLVALGAGTLGVMAIMSSRHGLTPPQPLGLGDIEEDQMRAELKRLQKEIPKLREMAIEAHGTDEWWPARNALRAASDRAETLARGLRRGAQLKRAGLRRTS
jgi:hypothetical protein